MSFQTFAQLPPVGNDPPYRRDRVDAVPGACLPVPTGRQLRSVPLWDDLAGTTARPIATQCGTCTRLGQSGAVLTDLVLLLAVPAYLTALAAGVLLAFRGSAWRGARRYPRRGVSER